MQRLEVSGAVRPLYGSLGIKGLITPNIKLHTLESIYDIMCGSEIRYGVEKYEDLLKLGK